MAPSPSQFLLTVVFFFFLTAAVADLMTEQAALLAFKTAVGRSVLPLWNVSNSPCSWQGVACEAGQVTVLRLPAVGLIGPIPVGIFSNLTSLRTLSLRYNGLSGPLPSDIVSLGQLRNLYLQNNFFTGEIPSGISKMQNVVRFNLAGNRLTGEIPDGIGNLSRLGTLFVENNNFTGQIPDFNLPNLVQFNVSFNKLNGSVPVHLQKNPTNAFLGMSLCGGPLIACPGSSVSPSPAASSIGVDGGRKKSKKLSGGAIAGIAIACVIAFLIFIALVFFLCCKRKNARKTRSLEVGVKPPDSELPMTGKRPGDVANGNGNGAVSSAIGASAFSLDTTRSAEAAGSGSGGGSKKLVFFKSGRSSVFDLEDLLKASAEVLGKGTFGTAYKAVLEMGTVAAVKRLKDVDLPENEFKAKIEPVGAMDHENLVPLRAYYYSRDEKLLVYDYMNMGSLSALLHGNRGSGHTPLNWESRFTIALSAAKGLEYIHSTDPNASHGNIKSSNILLTKSYEARVSDHGLAHLVTRSSTPNRVAGYRAPEVTDPRRVSQKADVYSFGVLLLELLTGKAPAQALLNDEGVDLPRWVQSVVKDEWTSEVFDMELLRYQNEEEEMVKLLQLAIDCSNQYPDSRPTMLQIVSRIQDIPHRNSEVVVESVDSVPVPTS